MNNKSILKRVFVTDCINTDSNKSLRLTQINLLCYALR